MLTLLLQCYLLHEKQVMHFNQQHSALKVCFANIVYSSPSYERPQSHLKKWSLKKGYPYLVGNQEMAPKALVPDYQLNKANPFLRDHFEVTFCGFS